MDLYYIEYRNSEPGVLMSTSNAHTGDCGSGDGRVVL